MRLLVRIYKYKGDYSALVPDLPGCVAAGDSVEEVRMLVTQAIKLHLDLMQKSAERIPKPSRRIEFAIDDSSEEEWCTWVDVEIANLPVAAASRRRRTG
jgi:predicted RNase H-like HicB family nuclease